ncbi:hypothetical protein R1flu_025958 [Riccia fluitans]|uniref:HNH endonuclease n=1 Tax=Riccia fluitans TaxID=41844 RepID=A0ABD1XHC7_9MARC
MDARRFAFEHVLPRGFLGMDRVAGVPLEPLNMWQPSWEMSGRVPDSTPRENDEAIADAILEQDALPPCPRAGRPSARRRFSMNSSVSVLATLDDRRNGRFQWESWMMETLLDLKKLEWEEYESQSSREHMINA